VTNTQPAEHVAAAEKAPAARLKWPAVACIGLAAAAFAVVLLPFGVIPAGVLSVAGLVVGILCLIRDPGFNLVALGGTVLSSAAVSAVAVVAVLRALGG
jgi:hypothetical protein